MSMMVERYPIRMFLILTFGYAWTIWSLSPLLSFGHQNLQTLLDLTGAFGPSLMAIIIVLLRENKQLMPDMKVHISMFVLSFSMLLFAVPTVFAMTFDVPTVIGMLLLADVAAYVLGMVIVLKDKHALFESALSYVYHKRWVFIALLLFPLLMFTGTLIDVFFGATWPTLFDEQSPLVFIISALLTLVVITVIGGSLGEELGWRGFLTDALIADHHPVLIGLLVGVLWSLWYAPLHFNGFYETNSIELAYQGFLLRFVWHIPLAFLLTWLYIRSKASTMLVIIMHTSVKGSQMLMPLTTTGVDVGILILVVFMAMVALFDPLMRRKNKARHFLYK